MNWINEKIHLTNLNFKELVLLLFVLFTPFQRLLNLPFFGNKFQLPEVFFFIILLIALTHIKHIFQKKFWKVVDIAVLLWPIANIVPSFFFGFKKVNIIDITGSIYLVLLYFSVRIISIYINIKKIYNFFIYSALLAGVLGIVGFLLSLFDITTTLANKALWPYFGEMSRIQAFTATPNMLASILMVGIIFLCSQYFNLKKMDSKFMIILSILSIAFILTFSKTIMCLLAGLGVTWFISLNASKKTKLRKLIFSIFILGTFIIYFIGTHFFITSTINTKKEDFNKMFYVIGKKPLFNFSLGSKEYKIYPTNYLINKKQSLRAIKESKALGLGAGNYNEYIEKLKKRKLHPSTFRNWDPHCTYLGVPAELGFFGLIIIILIWGLPGLYLFKYLSKNVKFKSIYSGLSGVYIAILIEASATDIMNFRHYWILIAFIAILVNRKQEPYIEPSDMAAVNKQSN